MTDWEQSMKREYIDPKLQTVLATQSLMLIPADMFHVHLFIGYCLRLKYFMDETDEAIKSH